MTRSQKCTHEISYITNIIYNTETKIKQGKEQSIVIANNKMKHIINKLNTRTQNAYIFVRRNNNLLCIIYRTTQSL